MSEAAAFAAELDDLIAGAAPVPVTLYGRGNPPPVLGTATAMLQETPAIEDVPGLAGVDPNEFLLAFFLSTTDPALVVERGYLRDAQGDWWLIQSHPAIQYLGGVVVGFSVFLRQQADAPVGS